MSGSVLGKQFTIMTWGESHGEAIGVVIDGCPSGIPLTSSDIQILLNRRKPGQSAFSTPRKESDTVEILSGIFEGKTTGTPISLLVKNENQYSADYSEIASYYRPGHADYTFDEKYGFRDYRGGGRSSGRETIGRVAAGAVAKKILTELGISVDAYTSSIGPITISQDAFSLEQRDQNALAMPDAKACKEAETFLTNCMQQKDSAGGIVECIVRGMPSGIGEPVFDKLSANLGKAVLSIGAVKGFEIGDGFEAARHLGSENNDSFRMDASNTISKETNHSGGILGGLSDGSPILLRAAIKPTPSIASTQKTVNRNHENIEVSIKGRHDPVIVPRAVVVVESMVAITIVDMLFSNMYSRMDSIKEFYQK